MVKEAEKRSNPKISVIITCYNDGVYIEEAIASVQKSTFTSWEIIIVDDCSSDPLTIQTLDKLASTGYQVLKLTKNAGVGNARNSGIQKAKGEYILPLDADDRILPEYLEKACAALEKNSNADVVYCNVKRFGDKDTTRIAPDFSFPALLAGNYIASCSLFRKSSWETCGGFDTAMPNYEDWEFWISIAENGKQMIHLDEVLFEYRARAGSKVAKASVAEHRANVVRYVCNKHKDSYKKYAVEIIPLLHSVISTNEELFKKQREMIGNKDVENILEKYTIVEKELIATKAYYENSFYIKLKRVVDRLKPGAK